MSIWESFNYNDPLNMSKRRSAKAPKCRSAEVIVLAAIVVENEGPTNDNMGI